jgi:hypothetical protein
MELTVTQRNELYKNGFVKIPGAISQLMVDRALQAINHSLGEGIDPEQLNIYRSQSYCPEIQGSNAIMDLFHKSPVLDLVGSVINLEEIEPVRHGQIALRFPEAEIIPRSAHPHIDGMYSPNNGVRQGEIYSFTALVCVVLSDLPNENAGNFTVWPGTHLQNAEYFKKHGADTLLNGMPPVEMPEPLQITGKPGDVIIAHYTLAHGVTPNVSPNNRYAIFYRIKHTGITPTTWRQSMEDIWMHWPGMRETVVRQS